MTDHKLDTEEMVGRAATGVEEAAEALPVRHRQRLKGMIAIRMDNRLAGRVDPSDIVQDTLVQAARQLPGYLREQPLPF